MLYEQHLVIDIVDLVLNKKSRIMIKDVNRQLVDQ